LNWGVHGDIHGDPIAVSRFTDLIGKTSKWFSIAALLLISGLVPAGLIFFDQGQHADPGFPWRLPWVLAVVSTGFNLAATPFFAVIMGSGDVVTVNHRAMVGMIAGSFIAWLCIGFHGGLYAVSAINIGNILITYTYLARQKPKLLLRAWQSIWRADPSPVGPATISWWDEVWPMQWKIALSWVSGYFLFQLFNPILFYYQGAGIAGRMGMTLNAANALLGASITILNAKNPEFAMLIARRDWNSLDRLFYRVGAQSVVLASAGAVAGGSVIWYLQGHHALGQRFLPAGQAVLLFLTTAIIVVIYGFATYLRAHKQEPLMYMSLITAVLQGSATWYLGKHYSSKGVILGYLATTLLISLPSTYFIWRRCRTLWHEQA
jgi:hypothetical protein